MAGSGHSECAGSAEGVRLGIEDLKARERTAAVAARRKEDTAVRQEGGSMSGARLAHGTSLRPRAVDRIVDLCRGGAHSVARDPASDEHPAVSERDGDMSAPRNGHRWGGNEITTRREPFGGGQYAFTSSATCNQHLPVG